MKLINILFIIIFIFTKQIKSDNSVDNCKERGLKNRVKSFSECEKESNYAGGKICCFYNCKNGSSYYEGCISLDSEIFSNKTVSYDFDTISFSIICDNNYNSGSYYKKSIIFIFFFFLFIIIL